MITNSYSTRKHRLTIFTDHQHTNKIKQCSFAQIKSLDTSHSSPNKHQYEAATILNVPLDDTTDYYRVQIQDSGDIIDIGINDIYETDPTRNINLTQSEHKLFPLIPWIQHDAKVTLYLPNLMKEPKQGYLNYNRGLELWTFRPGRQKSTTNTPIPLRDFDTLAQSMVQNKKIFQGWKTKHYCMTTRVGAKSNVIARHISAKGMTSPIEPSLCKHHELPKEDQEIWDASYKEEYDGLVNLDTWDFVTEDEYQKLKHVVGKALPTMAISTIKRDGNGNPVRAKYRIVALGNMDPHNWDKAECYAPVLSQAELRLLTAIATQSKRKLKSAEVSQAFCQSYLPGKRAILRSTPTWVQTHT